MNPQTPQEWQAYVASLSDRDLWTQTALVNSMAFVGKMKREGLLLPEINSIVNLFVKEMLTRGLKLPEGGVFPT